MMRWRAAGPARQLDFSYPGARLPARRVAGPRSGPARLCAVCGRWPARLTLERTRGGPPPRVCLRCHVTALRQRRSAHARRPTVSGRSDLIVPRESVLPLEAKYRLLSRSRREAQEVARRALASD